MESLTAQVRDLKRLQGELTTEISCRETSVPDEYEPPQPIRGRELQAAVQAVQVHYGGKLPMGPWQAWRGMLQRADKGTGEADPEERYERYYTLCETLLQWVVAELDRTTSDTPTVTSIIKSAQEPIRQPRGFMGGLELANALGVHPKQRDAFFRQLERLRLRLGDDSWHEVGEPRPNSPRYLYRADSPKLEDLAARYRTPKPA